MDKVTACTMLTVSPSGAQGCAAAVLCGGIAIGHGGYPNPPTSTGVANFQQ
jgi:hypothetical protein